jgi:hypothetical protein
MHIYLYIVHFITPTCFGASAPFSGGLYIILVKLENITFIELYKAVGRCMVKFVLFMCYNFSKTNYKLPENGEDAPKLVGAFVILFC